MSKREARRVTRDLKPEELRRLEHQREQIAAELPEMVARDRMRKEASEEATLSGELRRAIHASDHSVSTLAQRVGIPPLLLDDFLTGERTLRSDVLDRLAEVLGCQLTRTGC